VADLASLPDIFRQIDSTVSSVSDCLSASAGSIESNDVTDSTGATDATELIGATGSTIVTGVIVSAGLVFSEASALPPINAMAVHMSSNALVFKGNRLYLAERVDVAFGK
jgi:hypothetical protein